MSHRIIELDDRLGWEQALRGIPHAFAHTWESCRAMAASTGYHTYLWSLGHARGRFACPIAERRRAAYIDVATPYGFTGFVGTAPSRDLPEVWQRFATAMGYVCAYIVLNPVLSDPSYFDGIAMRQRDVYVLDLRLSEDELFSRLSTNRKRQIRRSKMSTGVIVSDQDRLAEFFLWVYPDFMRRHGAASVYDLSRASLQDLCGSRATFLVGAQRAAKIRAAALFGYTPYVGDYIFGVSENGEREYSAALIWEGALELRSRGVPLLNLGGGVKEGDGVEQFKQRFGGTALPLKSIRQIYRPDVYRQLCLDADVDPQLDSRYFPAYRAEDAAAVSAKTLPTAHVHGYRDRAR